MRLFSNAESRETVEPSLLALLETIAAVSLSAFLAVHFGTTKWIAITACLAPLALLRTDYSVDLGLRMGERVWGSGMKIADGIFPGGSANSAGILEITLGLVRLLAWVAWLSAVGLLMPLIRLVATAAATLRHPIVSIASIPRNWYRYIACIDTACSPEPLPGTTVRYRGGSLSIQRYIAVLSKGYREEPGCIAALVVATVALVYFPVFLVWSLPSLVFRWSMKATAIVYSPLLWVVGSTFRKIERIGGFLQRTCEGPAAKVLRLYSVAVILGFLTKCVLMMSYSTVADWWNDTPPAQFLSIYVVPHEIPLWQLAAFVNALVALGVLFLSASVLTRIRTGEAWPERSVVTVLRSTTFVRGTLSLYTISSTLYITIQAASSWHLPCLGTKLFPWS